MQHLKMDVRYNVLTASMQPLPIALSAGLNALPPGLPKRERTRAQLVDAALRVFSVRGVAAGTIQEIADVAGMTPGTVYNHFKTKEEVLREVALRLATTLCARIAESQAGVKEGARTPRDTSSWSWRMARADSKRSSSLPENRASRFYFYPWNPWLVHTSRAHREEVHPRRYRYCRPRQFSCFRQHS